MAQVQRATRASARRVAALAAALIVFAAPAASAQLITNGGFEAGLTGWTLEGYDVVNPFASGITTNTKHSGLQSIKLTRTDPIVWGPGYGTYLFQWLASSATSVYTLDWWVRGNGDATSFFSAYTSDGTAGGWNTLSTVTGSINGWTNYSATFNGTGGLLTVGFQSENEVEAYFLDDVSLSERVSALPFHNPVAS